jgi:phosphoribosylformylglycinamidine synthase
MAFAGGFGLDVDLETVIKGDDCSRPDAILFSESCGRYVIEIEPDKFDGFASAMLNLPFAQVGKVSDNSKVKISLAGESFIDAEIADLKQAWQKSLSLS